MNFKDEIIGGKLMEAITSGLYDGNLNCLREYVQNGIDSKADTITIKFENGVKNLIIKDDGEGMDQKELLKSLNIGISDKDKGDVGWRGIGIWSGVPSCKRMVIITKKRNKDKLRTVIDCEKIREGTETNRPILKILSESIDDIEVVPLGKKESKKEDHYTEMRLEEILPTQKRFFNKKEIRKYLQSNVPAPFDSTVFSIGSKIEKYMKDNGVKYPNTKIILGKDLITRPPTDDKVFFHDFITKTFTVNGNAIAIAWILTSKGNKVLRGMNRGIFFKKKGFTIGDENLVRGQFEGTYNYWQYGEIHIVSDELRENAARNNFEYNNIYIESFLEQISQLINQLQLHNRYQGDRLSPGAKDKIYTYLNQDDTKKASSIVSKFQSKIKRHRAYPTDPDFQGMKKIIDTDSNKQIKEMKKISDKIKKKKADPLKDKKDKLDMNVDHLHPGVKKFIKRTTKKGRMEPELSVTDSIKDILQKKTGLTLNEIHDLSQEAFGWITVQSNNKDPILTIAGPFDRNLGGEDRKRYQRNLRFGVFLYSIHDLFVNLYKHKKGDDSFKWFEDVTDEERMDILSCMYSLVDFAYRMIDKSDSYT